MTTNKKNEEINNSEDTINEDSINIEKITIQDYLQDLSTLNELLIKISKISLKELEDDLDKITLIQQSNDIKKAEKSLFIIKNNINDYILKIAILSIKKNKKYKKPMNKENHAINQEMKPFKEVLDFIGLPEKKTVIQDNTEILIDSTISRSLIIQSINQYVKEEKIKNNKDIYVEGDNKSFYLIGKLKTLFDFIKKEMIHRDVLQEEDSFPTKIAYTDIMKYLKYCFPLNH